MVIYMISNVFSKIVQIQTHLLPTIRNTLNIQHHTRTHICVVVVCCLSINQTVQLVRIMRCWCSNLGQGIIPAQTPSISINPIIQSPRPTCYNRVLGILFPPGPTSYHPPICHCSALLHFHLLYLLLLSIYPGMEGTSTLYMCMELNVIHKLNPIVTIIISTQPSCFMYN